MSEPHVLVASVTVVFDGPVSPEQLAEGLLAREEVSTVRIHEHGAPSACRVDVPAGDHGAAADRAAHVVADVASGLGVDAEVLAVTLATDDEREEVFRR